MCNPQIIGDQVQLAPEHFQAGVAYQLSQARQVAAAAPVSGARLAGVVILCLMS